MGKHSELKDNQFTGPIDDDLFKLFTSNETVSSLLAQDPKLSPGDAWQKLYGHHKSKLSGPKSIHGAGKQTASAQALQRAAECGKWGPTQPSELFLRIYEDALNSLEDNPAHGIVSPPLMGSCGVLPLTIISTIPDIVRHMSNLIVRAEREVYLATNFWQNSVASKFITDALRELSRRAGERGDKVVVKIIYDRGAIKNLVEPHYIVPEKEYTNAKVDLPAPHEIPNVDMQVMNYHHPLLGTFHAKFMVVDRKIAIIQSNNIQDNDNVEMMCHFEGPIVDSVYDMALLSWHKLMEPPLPSLHHPATQGGIGSFGGKHDGASKSVDVLTGPNTTADIIPTKEQEGQDPSTAEHEQPVGSSYQAQTGTAQRQNANAPNGPDSNTAAFLNDGTQDVPQAQISHPEPQHPNDSLAEHTTDNSHWDLDIAGEVARVQASVSDKPGETRLQAVNRHLNHTTNVDFPPDAPECSPEDAMTPYIPHPTHQPFPIAMVNRAPYGPPNHKSVSMPQNAAWLSALRNAERSVFIQSPTLNAEPLIPAIVEACERGVDVYCYICLGYNDAGELLPMQGGHNDMVADHLYKALSAEGKQRLHYFWYVGKDQTKPIVQEKKKRSCHIKLMIVDEYIGIQGNGNQDTQSWYHSQEVNVLLESADVCRAWMDGLKRNQNTHIYGALSKETGLWTDKDGKQAEGAIGPDPGRFSWATGVVGAVKRVQGKGGF